MSYQHTPVLLQEVLENLQPKKNQNFVDATFGGGGYTKKLLAMSKPVGKVLSIDLDKEALKNISQFKASEKRLTSVHGNFRDIDKFVVKHKFENISGIVADIGLSSFQIDASGRGISFQKKELLDMRFDQNSNQPNASFILNHWTQDELTKLFQNYSEDKHSRQIARKIILERAESPIKYTTDLTKIIEQSLPKPVKHRWADSARRIFQALRIQVNGELENLEAFLPKAFGVLAPGGRLAVVTFHSLEDRIVKHYFKELTKGCVCPLDFPICKCGQNPQGKLITKKAVVASDQELQSNSRAKSAKLRVIEKI